MAIIIMAVIILQRFTIFPNKQAIWKKIRKLVHDVVETRLHLVIGERNQFMPRQESFLRSYTEIMNKEKKITKPFHGNRGADSLHFYIF